MEVNRWLHDLENIKEGRGEPGRAGWPIIGLDREKRLKWS